MKEGTMADQPTSDDRSPQEPTSQEASQQQPVPPPDATTMSLSAVGSTEAAPQQPAEGTPGRVDDSTVASLRPDTALLRVDHGPNAGARFLLDAEVTTVGRHPQSDIFLDDVTVSRKHAEFVRAEGGGFAVKDVGSLNGTYVNRSRIESPTTLQTGDEVQIGKFRLLVHLAPPGDQE
jgi:pSer/pThr/pTyr-binding forkhead associated (FHA) protein